MKPWIARCLALLCTILLIVRVSATEAGSLPWFADDGAAEAAVVGKAVGPEVKIDRTQNVTLAGKSAGTGKAVRLFILSGQSNMAALDPKISFVPTIEAAFPDDELIFVKDAQSGQPIRRWAANWKPVGEWKGRKASDKPGNNDLYRRLMGAVKGAIKGKKLDSVSFVWMQGEADAKQGQATNYRDALQGLIQQVRDDLARKDVNVVVGRLSDHLKGNTDWELVREAQVAVADADPLVRWVETDDLNGPKDGLHYNGDGYKKLGTRFAEAAIKLTKMPGVAKQ